MPGIEGTADMVWGGENWVRRTALVKRFGRLQDHPNHTRRQQAYETRQGTKSRAVERLQCSGLDEGLIETRMLMRTEGA